MVGDSGLIWIQHELKALGKISCIKLISRDTVRIKKVVNCGIRFPEQICFESNYFKILLVCDYHALHGYARSILCSSDLALCGFCRIKLWGTYFAVWLSDDERAKRKRLTRITYDISFSWASKNEFIYYVGYMVESGECGCPVRTRLSTARHLRMSLKNIHLWFCHVMGKVCSYLGRCYGSVILWGAYIRITTLVNNLNLWFE